MKAEKKLSKNEIKRLRDRKKKSYKRFLKNQRLRRDSTNIRQIRDGEIISTW